MIKKIMRVINITLGIAFITGWIFIIAILGIRLFDYFTAEYYMVQTRGCGYVVYAKNPSVAAAWVIQQPDCGERLTEVREI
jgi:hypothetical protein